MDNYENSLWPLIYDQYNQGRHEKELEFYRAELRQSKGKALEIACGTGMIFLNLLIEGADIYGFDIAEDMLRLLYAKADSAGIQDINERVSVQNMVDFNYDTKFDEVLIPARSFLHLLTQGEQIACLRNTYNHLSSSGRLLINFFNPNLSFLAKDVVESDQFVHLATFDHPHAAGEKIELYYRQANNIPEQIQNITWKFACTDAEHLTTMRLRWIYKEEFKLLLRLAGLSKWELYGGFDKSPYSYESAEMVWIITKSASRAFA